jgi:hypothetical protein
MPLCDDRYRPHTDIEGTGQYTLERRHVYRRHTLGTSKHKHDYNTEMVTIHDPTGRTVGMLHPDRAQLLYRNYQTDHHSPPPTGHSPYRPNPSRGTGPPISEIQAGLNRFPAAKGR